MWVYFTVIGKLNISNFVAFTKLISIMQTAFRLSPALFQHIFRFKMFFRRMNVFYGLKAEEEEQELTVNEGSLPEDN
jgi:hypothetical protein